MMRDIMTQKDDFSLQVMQEYNSYDGEITYLEAVDVIRETHGLEPQEVKKMLTDNLYKLLLKESERARLVKQSNNGDLSEWEC